jgi:hypothetical protein
VIFLLSPQNDVETSRDQIGHPMSFARSALRFLQHSPRCRPDEFIALIPHLIANAVDGVGDLVWAVTGNVLRAGLH